MVQRTPIPKKIYLSNIKPARIVFDDWVTYDMKLIKDALKYFGFETIEVGDNKLLMEKNGN